MSLRSFSLARHCVCWSANCPHRKLYLQLEFPAFVFSSDFAPSSEHSGLLLAGVGIFASLTFMQSSLQFSPLFVWTSFAGLNNRPGFHKVKYCATAFCEGDFSEKLMDVVSTVQSCIVTWPLVELYLHFLPVFLSSAKSHLESFFFFFLQELHNPEKECNQNVSSASKLGFLPLLGLSLSLSLSVSPFSTQ